MYIIHVGGKGERDSITHCYSRCRSGRAVRSSSGVQQVEGSVQDTTATDWPSAAAGHNLVFVAGPWNSQVFVNPSTNITELTIPDIRRPNQIEKTLHSSLKLTVDCEPHSCSSDRQGSDKLDAHFRGAHCSSGGTDYTVAVVADGAGVVVPAVVVAVAVSGVHWAWFSRPVLRSR